MTSEHSPTKWEAVRRRERDHDKSLLALAAGGTGGHLFPAEALAQELKRRGHRILLVTDARGRRYAEKFPADESFEISAASPSIGGPVAKGLAALSLAGGLMTALAEFRKRKPAAAVGFGGYPSLPAMKAAAFLGVPYGVHEQNEVLGRANRMLASGAAFTAHGFPAIERAPKAARLIEVGNPVRDAVAVLSGAAYTAPYPGETIRLLIFGGSQGASIFSRVAPPALAKLPPDLHARLEVVQQAREGEIDAVATEYAAAGIKAEIAPFFGDLPQRIANAHLVIARAGASTVTELAAIGRPSILVPLAIAMDDHQTGNARVLASARAAIVMPEKEFRDEALAAALAGLVVDPSRLASMAAAAHGRVRAGAAEKLADLVEEIAVGARKDAA